MVKHLSLWSSAAFLSAVLAAVSCGGSSPTGGGGSGGAPVNVVPPAAWSQAVAAQRADLAADRPADAAGFQARWTTHYLDALPYDPLQAQGLDRITASHLGVSDAERQAIGRDGFVISARQTFPTFFYGYKAIYADHLPLYVSVDSVMHAVHRSYDTALKDIEVSTLIPTLKSLLAAMQSDLASGTGSELPAATRADVDLYLTVARQLLADFTAAPVAGGDTSEIGQLVSLAQAASGIRQVSLFGASRYIDFSQFKPRGHYAGDTSLEAYFRAMIWLAAPTPLPPVQSVRTGRYAATLLPARVSGRAVARGAGEPAVPARRLAPDRRRASCLRRRVR